MKRLILLPLVATMFSAPTTAAPCGKHEAALREAKITAWPDLYRRQDTKGLAAFLTDSFVMVSSDGSLSTAAEEIAWLEANPWQPQEFSYTITRIDCPAPNFALIVGTGRSVRASAKGGTAVHTYASSYLFLLQEGSWRAAMSHVSGTKVTEN